MADPVVTFSPAWLDACALVRMFLPHLHLPKSRFVFHPIRTPVEELAEGDIVVVQRQASQGNMIALKQMRDMGIRVVYDLDDDLWGIPGSSPAKRIFSPIKDGFGRCMEYCNAVTVSTEPLRTAVRTAVPPSMRKMEIFIIENGIDFNYMRPPLLAKPEGRVTLGWGGSNTHAGDVGIAWQVLPELLDELPQLYMEFVGMMPPKRLIGHKRVKTREFCPIGEYMTRYPTWGWDITLAPLDNVRFNRSKCLSTTTSVYCLLDGVADRRTLKAFVQSSAKVKCLPGPDGIWRRLVAWERMPEQRGYSVRTRSGDNYYVTPGHRFRLADNRIVEAEDLKVGDIIDEVTFKDLPELANRPIEGNEVADYEMGWFIGHYVGDGTMKWDEGPRGGNASINIHMDARRTDLHRKLESIAHRWGADCNWKPGKGGGKPLKVGFGNSAEFHINSHALKGFIQQYVSGRDCYTKHLLMPVWQQSLRFIRGIVDGWLDADGHRPDRKGKNRHVWGFGITQNWQLVRDLQLACLLIGYRFRYRRGWATEPNTGRQFKMIGGNVRKTLKNYQSLRKNGEILCIKEQAVSTIAVEVDGDNLFVLPSGLVTHNSGLKALEAAAIGAVCLMSEVKPYVDICHHSEETKWLLCRTASAWKEKIRALVLDEELRKAKALALRQVVEENYEQEQLMPKWREAFDYVMEQSC